MAQLHADPNGTRITGRRCPVLSWKWRCLRQRLRMHVGLLMRRILQVLLVRMVQLLHLLLRLRQRLPLAALAATALLLIMPLQGLLWPLVRPRSRSHSSSRQSGSAAAPGARRRRRRWCQAGVHKIMAAYCAFHLELLPIRQMHEERSVVAKKIVDSGAVMEDDEAETAVVVQVIGLWFVAVAVALQPGLLHLCILVEQLEQFILIHFLRNASHEDLPNL